MVVIEKWVLCLRFVHVPLYSDRSTHSEKVKQRLLESGSSVVQRALTCRDGLVLSLFYAHRTSFGPCSPDLWDGSRECVWLTAIPAWLQGWSWLKHWESKQRYTEKLGSAGLGSLVEKPQHPGSSVCLLCIVEKGGQGYCRELSKEARLLYTDKQGVVFILYSWTKEGRFIFIGTVFRSSIQRKKATFSVHTINIQKWTRRNLCLYT